MHNQFIPPNGGKMSATMPTFTSPTTDTEKKKYSLHAQEIFFFGIVATGLQIVWLFLDWPAYSDFFASIFRDKFPTLTMLLAASILVGLHIALAVTLRTYCWQKHDGDPSTNYPIWLPIVMAVLLLVGGVYGTKERGKAIVDKPIAITDEKARSVRDAEIDRINAAAEKDVAAITAQFDARLRSNAAAAANNIASWQRKEVVSDNDRAWIEKNINRISTAAAKATAKIEAEKAEKIDTRNTTAAAARKPIEDRFNKFLGIIDGKNAASEAAYSQAIGSLGIFSWLLSPALCILFFGLTNRRIALLCECGIRPTRRFNVIAKNGGWLGVLGNAISDGMARQMYRLSIWTHKGLTRGAGSLQDFDASLLVETNGYMNPSYVETENAKPTKTIEQAAAEVFEKLNRSNIPETAPGYIEVELKKSLASNGSYKALPLDPFDGKKDERDAQVFGQPVAPTAPLPFVPQTPQNEPEKLWHTVPQFFTAPQPVAQSEKEWLEIGGDELIELVTIKIKKDVPNLINDNGKAESVIGRINACMERAADRVGADNFTARRGHLVTFKNYLNGMELATKSKCTDWAHLDRLREAIDEKLMSTSNLNLVEI